MKKLFCIFASIAVLAALTGCTPKLSTAQACSEYNTLSKLMISTANDQSMHDKYVSQMKELLGKAPDTVKDDMHAIYLLMSRSPEAKSNPEAAQRIETACLAAK